MGNKFSPMPLGGGAMPAKLAVQSVGMKPLRTFGGTNGCQIAAPYLAFDSLEHVCGYRLQGRNNVRSSASRNIGASCVAASGEMVHRAVISKRTPAGHGAELINKPY